MRAETRKTLDFFAASAQANKGWSFAYVTDTHAKKGNEIWTHLKHVGGVTQSKTQEQQRTVHFANGSYIRLIDITKPDSMRGLRFNTVVVDEVINRGIN